MAAPTVTTVPLLSVTVTVSPPSSARKSPIAKPRLTSFCAVAKVSTRLSGTPALPSTVEPRLL